MLPATQCQCAACCACQLALVLPQHHCMIHTAATLKPQPCWTTALCHQTGTCLILDLCISCCIFVILARSGGGITHLFPQPAGPRLVLADEQMQVGLYSPLNDEFTLLPEYEGTLSQVRANSLSGLCASLQCNG